MSQHTPGPWQLSGPVLQSRTVRGCSEEARANARLIAAAPEMLAALKEIAAGRLDYEPDPEIYAERLRTVAKAALAKAEGRES
jgi:hypothetical protein